jgi:hypothetical protein
MRKLRFKIAQIIFTLILFVSSPVSGQEMLGHAFSLYSGLSAIAINPALLTGSGVYIELNVVSGDVSFANDMVYFSADNHTISKAIRFEKNLFNNGSFKWGRSFNYYNNTRDKYFASNLKLLGPSMMLQAGSHAFALSTTFRSFHSANHVPYEMPVINYEGLFYPEFHGVEFDEDPYSLVSMSWAEIGLSYAYNFYDLFSNRLTFGISVKALLGYEGAYVDMRNANFMIIDNRSIDFKNIDADIGYALPVGYGNEFTTNNDPMFKGYGVGVDFGLVFTKLISTMVIEDEDKLCAKPFNDYLYKIGLSVLDVGAITFNNHTELHKFNNVSKYWIDFDTIHYQGINNQMRVYSEGFYGDPDESYAGSQIKIGLPTTISLQFDYHLKQRIYLSALWMHPLKFNARTLWRPAQLAFIPRYENRYFGVSLPVSLFNYSEPRLGLAVRFYSITIGTDRLGWMLGLFKLDGMDFYFSFRFNIGKGGCASSRHGACSNEDFGSKW